MHATSDRSRRGPLIAAVLVLVVVAGVVAAALLSGGDGGAGQADGSAASAGPGSGPPPSAPAPAGSVVPATATPTPDCGPWGCPLRQHLAAAARLVGTEPGRLGVTVLDRRTGAVWEAGTASHSMWASSTPKLALATSLLERARTGEITLDATARRQLAAMLAVSDDDAADALWDRYGGAGLLPRFRDRYGMSGATFVPGFPKRWGFIKVSARDLRRLMTYVLTKTDPADRAYLVDAMRTTGGIQHWGVWAAGAAQHPGAKDGWSIESDGGTKHWCTSSVGFAGPDERYVVAVMDDLPPAAGIGPGVHATSDVVATIFGARTPAAVTVPDESTGR
ncbi:MAG TPA: serine hydrolase [Mycobacteriales bacterium]|nr:serine hydrolase [Mycobacteriales bacterium]